MEPPKGRGPENLKNVFQVTKNLKSRYQIITHVLVFFSQVRVTDPNSKGSLWIVRSYRRKRKQVTIRGLNLR